MQCQRCLVKSSKDDDDDDIINDTESKHNFIEEIACDLPCVLCLTCYADWYIAHNAMVRDMEKLRGLAERKMWLRNNPTKHLATIVDKGVDINMSTIAWIRKGCSK